ncbi:MAG TPA: endonuclease/exonuclease/phosphatase family protein, partial [Gaiellaceae bacterium]|nr:endonuclease/exonuclease/phosphatase family protein [Gaiellaceae bacterium]
GVFVGGRVVEYAYAAKELSVTTLVASAVVPDPKAPPLPPPVRIGVGPAPSTPVESQDSAAPAAESVATATLAAQPSATGTPAAQPPAPATPAAPSASTAAPAVAPGATVTTQPAPVPAGAYRKIPTTIEDDALATFDPDADRLDFWESLEGMRVEIPGGKVTEPTRSYGTLVLTPDTAGPRSTAGGLLLTEYGPSPQRYLLARGLVDKLPEASVGTAVSGPIDAVVDYAFSNYQLLPVAPLVVTTPGVDCKATTALAAAPGKLTIAAWNVDNLSITGSADRVAKIGKALVERLGAPAIVALEEVEDDSGSDGKGDGVVTSAKTLQAIVDAARGAGGPAYQPIWIDPEPDKEGGIPGGNIRVALLVDPARVGFHRRGKAGPLDAAEPDGVGARLHLTLDPGRVDPRSAAFTMTSGEGVRRSLAVELEANGKPLFVVVNHWSSKWDDDKDFGANQPPRKPTDAKRLAQAAVVRAFVDRLLAADAKARVIVLGDLNDFPWSAPIRNLSAPPLVDLAAKIPDADRYSLNFEGSSQLIDDVVVSPSLADGAELAPVHFDADCPDKVRLSDHDPVVARLPVH